MKPLTLRIFGMDCTACAPELKRILLKQNGVLDVDVSYTSGKASLTIEETSFDISQTKCAIERAGFAIPMEHVVLSCNVNVDTAEMKEKLSVLYGVQSVSVSESDHILILSLYPVGITREDLQQAVSPTTLSVKEWNSGEEELEQSDQLSMLRRLFISVMLATPIFWSPAPWIQFVLATILQFGPGRYFYRRCLRAIYSKQLNMDFLITLSTSIIYIYSTVLTFTVHDNIKLYYLCDGVLMSLIFFGKYLEIIAKGQTSQSIRGLVHLIPQEALCVKDGQEIKIPSDALKTDDIVKIEAGMRIPADGILLDDMCYVDESMLTGESEPIQKSRGEHLTGGSLNRNNSIYMKVTHTGRETTLQQMISMVQIAQSSRAPLQNIVDRIAAIFIPGVLIISVLVFAIRFFFVTPDSLSDAILTMCGVLVVACPCALGLATPTSIMVGTGRAAELGILFRNAEQLEQAAKADTVVFDKTGTLTLGSARLKGAADVPREDASEAVRQLEKQRIEVIMLSGDKKDIAEKIALQIGIRNVIAEVTPEQKTAYIHNLKSSKKHVVMVGDGINDAPALASADVSIVLPDATDAARDAAGIVLTTKHLTAIPQALRLAKSTIKNIHGNLLWALCYNLVCIPLAACGVMNPSIASAAMSFSSIAVLMHALHLKNAETKEI